MVRLYLILIGRNIIPFFQLQSGKGMKGIQQAEGHVPIDDHKRNCNQDNIQGDHIRFSLVNWI